MVVRAVHNRVVLGLPRALLAAWLICQKLYITTAKFWTLSDSTQHARDHDFAMVIRAEHKRAVLMLPRALLGAWFVCQITGNSYFKV
eukprot:scaffold140238_cov17-Prasinocladus_malaysianus.AAC.3